ncbi:tRNA acetyltransferase TAN1 [Cyphellophora attinorum]|uniref:tRNA acetyltransferase TAN1 n=1 Tax=Cyphellophora attinorum TaxID=1664694 RepID=A0A0N1NXQ6_9EURO|nr:tRNA acetyltransferase TAN1 [Phialophora attinorum]KPI35667.1 tRNA acetyltransferase TAN1 [Phialophora attinorum]
MADQDTRSSKRQKFNGGSAAGNKSKYRSQAAANGRNASGRKNYGASLSASGLISGDVGIFVTCDKGKEKSALREMADMLTEEMDLDQEDDGPSESTPQADLAENGDASLINQNPASPEGIEDEIKRELAELVENDIVDGSKKRKRTRADDNRNNDATEDRDCKKPRLELVTLDIPCVTFIRFPTSTSRVYDPVDIVTKICKDAKADPSHQRSRFVKRLTPLSKVRKVMSGGVEELCGEILPAVFGAGDGAEEGSEDGSGYKYAIRVTVRNNDKVKKDDIIKTVAEEVRRLGQTDSEEVVSRHRVDLKGYDKLVLVEVYRNVVGMAVVDGEGDRGLRRFNLAEIYADGRREEEAATAPQTAKEAPETI